MTTEDLHGHKRRSAPPANGRCWSALLPPFCTASPDLSSFLLLKESPMAPIVLPPGIPLTIQAASVATEINVSFRWRERPLEQSETR